MSEAYLRRDRDIWRKVAADEFGKLIIAKQDCAVWQKTANDYLPRIERLEDANEKLQCERDKYLKASEGAVGVAKLGGRSWAGASPCRRNSPKPRPYCRSRPNPPGGPVSPWFP